MITAACAAGPIASPSQISSHCSSMRSNALPRAPNSAPAASKSSSRPPTATPSTSRPPDSASTEAACLASIAPLTRSGAIRIVVASLIRSVTAAAAASAISGS